MKQTTDFLPSRHGWPFKNDFGKVPGIGGLYLCGGMCFSALAHWRDGKPIPASPRAPKWTEGRFWEIFGRQTMSLASRIGTEILKWHRMPDHDGPDGKPGIGTRTAAEWPEIRRRIDRGEPVVLCLIRRTEDLTGHHQVVAFGYDYDEASKRVKIAVYDPNYPGRDDVTLSISLARPSDALNPRQSTGDSLRGFFVV
jgi:hypothetical protein